MVTLCLQHVSASLFWRFLINLFSFVIRSHELMIRDCLCGEQEQTHAFAKKAAPNLSLHRHSVLKVRDS